VGKTIEEIIKDWNSELEKRSRQFASHASTLAEWDRHIRSNRRTLLALEAQTASVQAANEALEQQLDFLEVHQKEIHEGLESIEGEVKRALEEAPPGNMDSAAGSQQREELYSLAEELSAHLHHSGLQLRDLVTKVNQQQTVLDGDHSNPLAQVTQILNNQLNVLTHIDNEVDTIATQLDAICPSTQTPTIGRSFRY